MNTWILFLHKIVTSNFIWIILFRNKQNTQNSAYIDDAVRSQMTLLHVSLQLLRFPQKFPTSSSSHLANSFHTNVGSNNFQETGFLAQRHRPKEAGGEYSSKERKTFSTIILTNQRTFLPCRGKHWSNLIQYIYL